MASLRGLVRTTRPARPCSHPIISRPSAATVPWLFRCASSQSQAAAGSGAAADPVFEDLETESSMLTPPLFPDVQIPSPLERASRRKERLPGSRYQYHPPKYNRGPLHPIQSPPSSDPVARDFEPGPFHLPRLRQTYQSTIAADLMTLAYTHVPPGQPVVAQLPGTEQRLRSWDGSSPYHKNRPLRGPRGGDGVLRPLERPVTFRTIPDIRSVTLASFMPEAVKEKDRLVVAKAVLQAITGRVATETQVKHNVAQWGIHKGQRAGAKVTVYGNDAYEFLDKCIHLVFPRIKDWPGVPGSTGDSSGNLSWGLTSSAIALFPEIEVNYSMYPANMIPGCRVFVETTARSDRQARLLLQSLGVPFYGLMRD